MNFSPADRVCNAIELAFHNLTPAISRLGMASKGRQDMIDPDKVLAQVADLKGRLKALEAAAKAEKRARKEAARIAAKAAPKPKLVASTPARQDNAAVEGLVAMAKLAA